MSGVSRSCGGGFPGFVYFLRDGDAIKVGFSSRLKERLSVLQAGNPRPLELLFSLPGDQNGERALQRALKEHRIRNEWFRANGLRQELELLRSSDSESLQDLVCMWFERHQRRTLPSDRPSLVRAGTRRDNLTFHVYSEGRFLCSPDIPPACAPKLVERTYGAFHEAVTRLCSGCLSDRSFRELLPTSSPLRYQGGHILYQEEGAACGATATGKVAEGPEPWCDLPEGQITCKVCKRIRLESRLYHQKGG